MRPMPTVTPRLNHGRWIVDCPSCNAADLLEVVAGRDAVSTVYLCRSTSPEACGNVNTGRGMALVEIDRALLAAVDSRTSHRPVDARNWSPGESLADLELENRMRGYPSEAGALVASPDGLVERL